MKAQGVIRRIRLNSSSIITLHHDRARNVGQRKNFNRFDSASFSQKRTDEFVKGYLLFPPSRYLDNMRRGGRSTRNQPIRSISLERRNARGQEPRHFRLSASKGQTSRTRHHSRHSSRILNHGIKLRRSNRFVSRYILRFVNVFRHKRQCADAFATHLLQKGEIAHPGHLVQPCQISIHLPLGEEALKKRTEFALGVRRYVDRKKFGYAKFTPRTRTESII